MGRGDEVWTLTNACEVGQLVTIRRQYSKKRFQLADSMSIRTLCRISAPLGSRGPPPMWQWLHRKEEPIGDKRPLDGPVAPRRRLHEGSRRCT